MSAVAAAAGARPLRVFFATGEPSGDMLAASLATAMRARDGAIECAGIGSDRMAAAGIRLTTKTTGWASLGPVEAIRRIPPLFVNMWRHALWLRAAPFDLIVMIDFGAYNLRFAKTLRMLGYRRPIAYYFPPGAWLDRPSQARAVARWTTALSPFAHQRDFYRELGLPVVYLGHPLVSLVAPRPPRPPAPAGGGTIALLPGSRAGEIERHVPVLAGACRIVRRSRPNARFVISAADADAERSLRTALRREFFDGYDIVRGARAALDGADAAWIASGTAVLEAALREVPCVALYVVSRAQVSIAKRVWTGRFITLPNILLDRPAIPELLQDDANPERLAETIEAVLAAPASQLDAVRALREQLGTPDALERAAAFALELARA